MCAKLIPNRWLLVLGIVVVAPAVILAAKFNKPMSTGFLGAAQSPAPPQCEETQDQHFGRSLAGGCDLDVDGIPDQVIGAPEFRCDGGGVYFFSGADRHLINVLYGENIDDDFGFSVACLDDVNGDGVADFLVGAPGFDNGRGKTYVFAGSTFELIHSDAGEAIGDRFGFSVDQAGYMNGDSHPEIIVGAPGAENGRGRIYVYQGGSWIQKFWDRGEAEGDSLGYAVAGAGDVNNDGVDDVVVGAPYYDGAVNDDNGRVYALSGNSSGSSVDLLCYQYGGQAGAQLGWSVSGLGDIDEDGKDEFLAGSPGVDANNGVVHVLGCVLCIGGLCDVDTSLQRGFPGYRFGHSVACAGDIDNDTEPDFMVGAPGADNERGMAYVFLGDEYIVFCSKEGGEENDEFGYAVSTAGELNQDNDDDFIVGARFADCTPPPMVMLGPGKAYLYNGDDCGQLDLFEDDLPEFTILEPDSGDTVYGHRSLEDTIVWAPSDSNLAPLVMLRWSSDSGDTWTPWVDTFENDGSHAWIPPCTKAINSSMIQLAPPFDYTRETSGTFSIAGLPCKCGDKDDNGIWNISDAVMLIYYLFGFNGGRPWRPCLCDTDGNSICNISDAVYMISYLFGGGPEPGGCDPCQSW